MVNMDKNNIVYIQIDTWYNSDLSYLQELEDGEDFICPHCEKEIALEWGEDDCDCGCCDHDHDHDGCDCDDCDCDDCDCEDDD
jgi:hypothetical protein